MRYPCTCPYCYEEIINDQMLELPLRCYYCDWTGQFKTYEDHLNLYHADLICAYCGQLLCGDGESDMDSSVQKDKKMNHPSSETLPNATPPMRVSIRLSRSNMKFTKKESTIRKNKAKTVQKNIQNLNDQCVPVGNGMQDLRQKWSSLKRSCEQQLATIKQRRLGQTRVEQRLQETRQQLEDYHYVSYDGSLIWTIEGFKEKFHAAETGRQTSIFSPVFYTSPSGYKMRARLDLYGYGDFRSTHMSVFLVILQGDFDAIVTWPFEYQVIFGLFDQTGHNHHIVDAFRPETTSISFQRPSLQETIPGGIPKFCSLEILKQPGNIYVQDDTMYLKIKIDFFNTPRSLLPSTIAMNLALPTHLQNDLHCRELEQYHRARTALIDTCNLTRAEMAEHGLIPMSPLLSTDIIPPPSTTNLESISCEELLRKE